MRLGKPKFSRRGTQEQVETICLVDHAAYAAACDAFDKDISKDLARSAEARRSLTDLPRLKITE